MRYLVQRLKLMYAVAALSGAFLLHACSQEQMVLAQDHGAEEIETRIQDKLIDRLDAKQSEIDRHLEATDTRLNELSDKVSVIQGVGTGVLGVLGVLQILGLVASVKQQKGSSGIPG